MLNIIRYFIIIVIIALSGWFSINGDFEKEEEYTWIEDELSWKYKDEVSTTLPIKSTVSKIKQIDLEENILDLELLKEKQIGFKEIIPKFMEDKIIF